MNKKKSTLAWVPTLKNLNLKCARMLKLSKFVDLQDDELKILQGVLRPLNGTGHLTILLFWTMTNDS